MGWSLEQRSQPIQYGYTQRLTDYQAPFLALLNQLQVTIRIPVAPRQNPGIPHSFQHRLDLPFAS